MPVRLSTEREPQRCSWFGELMDTSALRKFLEFQKRVLPWPPSRRGAHLVFYRPRDHLGKCSRSTSTKMQPEIPELRKEEKCKSSRSSTWFFKGGYSHSTFDCKMISGRETALPRPVGVSHRAQAWSLAMTERGVDDQLVLPSSPRGPCA